MPVTNASATIVPGVLDPCSLVNMTTVVASQLTVATTDRRVAPYLGQNDRDEWVGTEPDVVYSVAEELGFTPVQVTWIEQPLTVEEFVRDGVADFLIGQLTLDEASAARAVASTPYGQTPDGARSVMAFVPGNPLVTCVDRTLTELPPDSQVTES
jgi:ABC-type amino acid transport substrate-binding protein